MDNSIQVDQLPEVQVDELELDEIELANLDEEIAQRKPSHYRRALEAVSEFASFSTLLRMSGALTLIASMSVFLLQDWVAGDDVSRFYMLLAQTGLLAAGGLGLGFLLREDKGARVFFGLGLLSICANVTTLGALIYSVVQWDIVFASLPTFASWQGTSWREVSSALAIAIVVFTPIALFSYRVLARGLARSLSLYFLLANSMLLLPARESWMSAVTILLAVSVPLHFLYSRLRGQSAALTRENIFSVVTLFVPAMIVIVRNLLWYRVDELLQITLALALYLVIRQAANVLEERATVKRALAMVSVSLAGYIALTFADYVSGFGWTNFFLSLWSAVFAFLVLDIAERSGRDKSVLAKLAGGSMVIGNVAQLLMSGGIVSALLCIASGIAVIAIGKYYKSKSLMIAGAITIPVGVGEQLYRVAVMVDFGSWISLAILGASAIVIASLAERYGAVIKLKWEHWSVRKL